ncbi:gamma-glutamyltransferase [Halorubrum lacusprofundi]|jgi:gamma-glutamyltranspeptidase/glutathione hydrolase|uniref:Gamma-glutamyltransferase n=1 Tax=Halorubrum lacusprofundi (strain ATCC 49239 / DSM 5036 / JCM 8891 / ACAM 34) TaxID=416348 RepID=B9LR14_HALLT|nr:gamma-glutamyltransferase [Halorubrum lacusprofundi]ACM57668.1 gamma-glutamyltransferase [Halorubrum lacusprofundi ATCC 49239]MCG1005735.1 gamma-glutamyltransferase [Halorubrum lacusprofundi]
MDPDVDRFGSRRSTVYGQRGVVATSQPLASEAGIEVLRDGGNAFDAAVATAAALNVVEPTSTGLGGDVFALYRTADGEVGAMRACGGAPADATVENAREALAADDNVDGDDPIEVEMPETGAQTVTVPGTARGWEATAERFGEFGLDRLLQPAIRYATEGYPVSEVIADAWTHGEDLFESDHAREAYLFGGESPTVGQRVTLPRLGESLALIAEEGADAVYEGEIAESIAEEVQAAGGFMTVEDLADFEVEWPEPVSTTYNGAEVYELPPNNQGLIALEALNVAAEVGAGEYDYDAPERVHYFAEALKVAFHDGHRYITDPAYEEIPPLASASWAKRRATEVGEMANHDVGFGIPDANAEDADTVLLTVADDEGNVVSYINSRFAGFGSGLVAGETGIALQNRGSSFSLDPDHPNRLEPGKRPFHTLIPGLIRFDEDDWAAFGVMGGYMQPQGHVQVVSNLVDYGMPLQQALDEPRWRYRESGELALEPQADGAIAAKLARKGHDVLTLPPAMFGGAQIARSRDGVLSAATEPRKDGNAQGY